ncbi:SusC/RagA family TonB-linked outer membrane protein [Arundinibacter roseus]|uniref:TonB-dependent receptor n=1 Tax=Arundinibacter roseus TaxID=2070510 RepID=A0A4R4KHF4_9BACT|nr:TonB-dependent receptor [Arundinibacter roseus]TDB67458.1 TonB-dependent receptor [Arundinibacter roseus]
MKKLLHYVPKPYRIMRSACLQLMLVLLFGGLSIAKNTLAQEILSKPVSIQVKNQKLESILHKLEKATGVKFTFVPQVLQKAGALSISAENESLESVLNRLLIPQQIIYLVNGNYIVLKKAPEKGSSSRQSDQPAESQSVDITLEGTVKDETGEGLPGVSIVLKGTQRGTTTNAQGAFTLNVPDQSAILIFSFVGYLPQEVEVGSRTTFAIQLVPENKSLNEVIVVGYGQQSKAKLIGSVAQINAEQINNRTNTQLSQTLAGQMPGVTVIQRSGQPGASGGTIQIRGVGSFGANTNPLILVDGIPANSFNNIDPNDVESISVLKDASSAAIYGARAANGVILVTTKTGKAGKLRIGYNGYVGFQKPTALPEFVNSWEYAELLNEADPGSFSQEQIAAFKNGSDPDNFPNSDFPGMTLKKSAAQTSHNLSISNGNDNNQYMLSFGYLGQAGIIDKNQFDRFNIRLNLTSTLSKKLKLTTRLSAIQTIDKQPAPPATLDFNDMVGIINQTVRMPAIFPIQYSNGDWGTGVSNKGTSVSYLRNDSFYTGKTTDLGANLRLDYTILPELKFSVLGGYTQLNGRDTRFLATQRLNPTIVLGPSSLAEGIDTRNYRTIQAFADYTTTFGAHEISFLGGYSFESEFSENLSLSRSNLPTNVITVIAAGDASAQITDGSAAEWALESYFGRAKYAFQDKYLLEGAIRYDGSSRFPTNQKYALFPSVAVGWRLGEERFIKEILTWIDELKLKASVGTLGNQNIGNYPYQNVLNTGFNYAFGGSINTGVARTTITDTTLHWESTRTRDIGLEGSFFKRSLNFSVTYFNKFTYDILVSPASSVARVLGFTVGQQNSGKLSNNGWEFTLDHRRTIGDFAFSVGGNLTYINNSVVDLGVGNITQPNGLVGNGSTLFLGYPMNLYYGYETDGLFTDEEDVKNWVNQSAVAPNSKPGDIRYRDISGPDGVPDGKVDPTYDRTVLGSTIPKLSYGINLSANFKGFDLTVLFQGVGGVNGYLNNHAGWAFFNSGGVQRWHMDERWTPENPDRNAGYPRMELISNTGTNNATNAFNSSFWILNGSYLRLKNLQVGYTFPQEVLKRFKMANLRMYANAENLFLLSQYRKGWDPEINTGGAFYPILANYTFGLNINF